MKIRIKDTCEVPYAHIPGIAPDPVVTPQQGMELVSEVDISAFGVPAKNFVFLLVEGAEVDLPKALAERLIAADYAEAAGG